MQTDESTYLPPAMSLPPIRPPAAPSIAQPQTRRPSGFGHIFGGLSIASSGMTAESVRMSVAAHNIANAETTHTAAGGPYARLIAMIEADSQFGQTPGGVHVAGIRADETVGDVVYNPGHPDADRNGYVRMPNVNPIEELMGMKDAGDSFSANATVFAAISSMLRKGLKI